MQDYVVKKGDSLWSIAKKYEISVDEIIDLNNLLTNTLQIGQILKIPTQSKNNQTYTVKRGDTIFMGNNE